MMKRESNLRRNLNDNFAEIIGLFENGDESREITIPDRPVHVYSLVSVLKRLTRTNETLRDDS